MMFVIPKFFNRFLIAKSFFTNVTTNKLLYSDNWDGSMQVISLILVFHIASLLSEKTLAFIAVFHSR